MGVILLYIQVVCMFDIFHTKKLQGKINVSVRDTEMWQPDPSARNPDALA